MDKKNITCSECDIPDVGCWEQCKKKQSTCIVTTAGKEDTLFKRMVERCRGCMGATFLDCFNCRVYEDKMPEGHEPIEDDMEGI